MVKIAIIQCVRAKSGCTALDLATLVDSNQVNMVLIVDVKNICSKFISHQGCQMLRLLATHTIGEEPKSIVIKDIQDAQSVSDNGSKCKLYDQQPIFV